MSKISGKVNYKNVLKGDTGFTFTPHITREGVLYWSNNGGLENPLPVNLHGEQGFIFYPSVDEEGNLSWSNNGELENPPTINIRGDKGYFYTPHISEDGILSWSNNGNLENPQPFNISDLILNEVKQARSATTGEKFNSLDERIDHEVLRLREKIEVSMLEQEDKESHVVENTVEGITTNMIIKGKTLFNLCTKVKQQASFFNVEGNTISTNGINGEGNIGFNVLLKPSKTYTIIINIIENTLSNQSIYFDLFPDKFEEFTPTPPMVKGIKLIKFTTPNDINDLECFRVYFPGADVGNIKFEKPIILEGDWLNKEIPKYFEGIKSFGKQEDKISILSKGKNLIDGIFYNKDGIVKTDKEGLINFENNIYNFKKENDGVWLYLPNGIYNLSGFFNTKGNYKKVEIYKTNIKDGKKYSGWNVVKIETFENDMKKEFTIEKTDCNYIIVYLPVQISEGDLTIRNFQISEGREIKDFEPYKCNKKDILLQKFGFDNGLNGINNINDELNDIRGVAIKRIGKREYREGDLLLENVITDQINTYFILDEPIEKPLTENINLKVFNEKTYVDFENSLKGTSNFKVPVNTVKVISSLSLEKNELNKKFNNLSKEFEEFKIIMLNEVKNRGESNDK